MNTVASLPAKWRKEVERGTGHLNYEADRAMLSLADELEAALASPAPSAGVEVDTSPEVVDKVVEHVRRWMGPIGRDIGAAHVATLQGAILGGLVEARKTLSLQRPAAPSVSPAGEGEVLDYVRATYQQIGVALKEHRKDDPFVLVDPVALLGWYNAIAKFAGRLATPEQPGSAVQGECETCGLRQPAQSAEYLAALDMLANFNPGADEFTEALDVLRCAAPAAPAAEQGDSRSRVRRIAIEKGEPAPRFDEQPEGKGADRMAIRLLVAAGHVTEAKANEALCIAHGFEPGPLAPAAPVGVDEWRSIESAPRDGSIVLIGRPGARFAEDLAHVAAWETDPDYPSGGHWMIHDGKTDHPLRGAMPTVWQPIKPPAALAGKEGAR